MILLLLVVSLVTASSGCSVTSSTPFKTRLSCGGLPISMTHRDSPTTSFFSLATTSNPELIVVTYSNQATPGNSMEILVNGERRELSDPLVDVLTTYPWLGAAARTVHDKLKLPGWKRPSIMFLYRLGMAALQGPEIQQEEDPEFREVELKDEPSPRLSSCDDVSCWDGVDKEIARYHGPSPTLTCSLNGISAPNSTALIQDRCFGVCGPACKMCWEWVCGDCCIHTGCTRHDEFCRGHLGKFHTDCMSFRGVLWDTVTDTPFDC